MEGTIRVPKNVVVVVQCVALHDFLSCCTVTAFVCCFQVRASGEQALVVRGVNKTLQGLDIHTCFTYLLGLARSNPVRKGFPCLLI
jgi:hypothetical protein